MTSTVLILLAVFFVFLNAFFVAAEFSIVKIRHTRVQAFESNKGIAGKTLVKVHQQLDAYLSACQLGITLASLGLGWVGEPAFAKLIEPLLYELGITSKETITIIAFFLAFGFISYLHIVIGELMPKSIAIRKTETIALLTAIPLYLFYWFMYPAIWFLNLSSNFLLKLCKLHRYDESSLSYSSDEIQLILRASHRYGEFSKSEFDLLKRSLVFTDLEISDVMRPLNDLVVLDINKSLEENMHVISKKQFSRYPVYKYHPSNIVGIVHIKDLVPVIARANLVKNLSPFIRPILKVKADDNLLDVFHKFRQGKPHLAIVVLSGKSIGFVTLDNILRAIIGEIKDEFHITKEEWIALEDGSFIIKGSAPIFTLESLLEIELPTIEANTVSGLILETLKTMPKEKEKIEFNDFTIVIKRIRGPRILQVRVYPKKKSSTEESSS